MAWPFSANPDNGDANEYLTPGARTVLALLNAHKYVLNVTDGIFQANVQHVYQAPAFPSPPTSLGREAAAACSGGAVGSPWWAWGGLPGGGGAGAGLLKG